ncbi:MAG TPA: integrin alpha, partial [Jatrophihabitantaceae bacterium]|nr:integrin alpha [Jatrophihabitantaceae bacterium]
MARRLRTSSVLVGVLLLVIVPVPAASASKRAVDARADGAFWSATPHELRLRGSVGTLAADSNRVAFSSCWWTGAVWQPGHDPHFFGGEPAGDACTNPPLSFGGFSSFAVAGERVAYLLRGGGIGVFGDLFSASAQNGYRVHAVASFGRCCAGDPVGSERWGDLVGGGDTIAYATWDFCGIYTCDGSPVHVTNENVNRVDDSCVASAGFFACPHLPNPGTFVPLAAARGRILARRGDGALVELRASDLAVLRTFRVGTPLDAALAGRLLVVLVPGALRVVDTRTGHLLHRWPLRGVPVGGVCTELPHQCPSPELEFAGAANGLAAYIADGIVHVVRLADGLDVVIARGTHARVTSAGLFYAYAGPDPWPGRVHFVPRAQLFRAQMFPGSPAPPPRTELFAQTTLQLIGPFPDGRAGSSIAAAGDVNGDGHPDVVVGTEGASPNGRTRAGAAFLVFGRRKAGVVQLAKLGAGGFEIDGSGPEAFAGATVAGLGDVNGDGLADVAVSEYPAGSFYPAYGRPRVVVILGSRSSHSIDLASRGPGAFSIDGLATANVAAAGDVNGDGSCRHPRLLHADGSERRDLRHANARGRGRERARRARLRDQRCHRFQPRRRRRHERRRPGGHRARRPLRLTKDVGCVRQAR